MSKETIPSTILLSSKDCVHENGTYKDVVVTIAWVFTFRKRFFFCADCWEAMEVKKQK